LKKTYPEGFSPYGADALRYTLLSYSPHTTKIALSIKRIEGYRNFANKLWNAARYALINLQGSDARAERRRPDAKAFANRWILSRLAQAIETAHAGIAEYRLDEASNALYRFVWHELCDWYLELAKPLLAAADGTQARETRAVLVHVLETALRLLHPMMPFITEEIWQRVPRADASPKTIMLAPYPQVEQDALRAPEVEREMTVLQAVIVAARAIRSERDIHPRNALPLRLRSDDAALRALLTREQGAIASLCNAQVTVESLQSADNSPNNATAIAEGVTVVVPLEGLLDVEKERERLQRQLQKLDKDRAVIEKKLGNPGFIERAPADVVQKDRERLAELSRAREQLAAALVTLG
jgi:valyl-tRNA synthetase